MAVVLSRTCAGCGTIFELRGGRGRPRRYCTDECRDSHPDAKAARGAARTEHVTAALSAPNLARCLEAVQRAGLGSVSEWVAELVEDTLALEDRVDEIVGLVSGVVCEPFVFELDRLDGLLFVRAKLWRPDAETSVMGWGYGARYLVHGRMDPGEIVKKCFVAARDFAEHEVREAFAYRARKILSPHIPIDRLWDAAGPDDFVVNDSRENGRNYDVVGPDGRSIAGAVMTLPVPQLAHLSIVADDATRCPARHAFDGTDRRCEYFASHEGGHVAATGPDEALAWWDQ